LLPSYAATKNVLDRCLAVLLLIPGLPLIGLLVLLIKATSRGPGIYSQQRVGLDGVVYTMYKLRSMRSDAEAGSGPVWSTPGHDPRVTPLGYWLRKLHLDELPQLFNVLRGEMALIGPRPERPSFVADLSRQIPGYRDRLKVRPGITGLAQINLPPDTDIDDVRRKLVLDKEYIETASPLLDARILACTFLRLCGLKGRMAMRAMWLEREVILPPADAERTARAPRIPVNRIAHHFARPDALAPTTVPSANPAAGVLNAFTVDVEDYFQVTGFEKQIPRSAWDSYPSRVVANTQRLLELLHRKNVRGTFFILGWVADRYPELVREIQSSGHELGCHSYWHRLIYSQTPDEFREDLRQAKAAIENAAGLPVTSYRAPSFSITRRSLWALDILAEEGFISDSSIVPARHDRYGILGADRGIHDIPTAAGAITEFPPSVAQLVGMNLPVGGGGYFRLYPWAMSQMLQQHVQRQRPLMFYIHPWEVDPEQPTIMSASRVCRFRHYVNLGTTYAKLERLLDTFRFGTMGEAMSRQRQIAADTATDMPLEMVTGISESAA
jgi:polysaccharide deacetylase family protein (PEP-CTERM system associated)